jgi:hypothetical protein
MTDRTPHRNFGTTYVALPVRLVDGREVLSDSEEWRHQCEAQTILNMPGKLKRQAMLTRVEEKRGKLSRTNIELTIMALWKASRPASAA